MSFKELRQKLMEINSVDTKEYSDEEILKEWKEEYNHRDNKYYIFRSPYEEINFEINTNDYRHSEDIKAMIEGRASRLDPAAILYGRKYYENFKY